MKKCDLIGRIRRRISKQITLHRRTPVQVIPNGKRVKGFCPNCHHSRHNHNHRPCKQGKKYEFFYCPYCRHCNHTETEDEYSTQHRYHIRARAEDHEYSTSCPHCRHCKLTQIQNDGDHCCNHTHTAALPWFDRRFKNH